MKEMNALEILDNIEAQTKELRQQIQPFFGTERTEQARDLTPAEVDPIPWFTIAKKFEGLHEEHDNAELQEFLGINPDGKASDGKSWCAGFVSSTLEAAGYPVPEARLTAASYAGYGIELIEPKIGCIITFRNHAAYVAEIEPEILILGGNQSDKVCISPRRWYDQISEFTGYRWPPLASTKTSEPEDVKYQRDFANMRNEENKRQKHS